MVTREAPSITTEECDPKSGNVQYMTVNKKKRGWHNMYKKRGWHYMYTVLGESGAHGHRYSATSVSIVI